MRDDGDEAKMHARALALAIAWLLISQVACVALWSAGVLTRQSSLVHWLLVGVLPPAMALWRMERQPKAG